MKIGRGVSELWRVENRPLPLTWPMAYTTACTTVEAVIHTWAGINNLNLNLKKSAEIVFVDKSRYRQMQLPSPLDSIARVSSIKILGAIVSNRLSVSGRVH